MSSRIVPVDQNGFPIQTLALSSTTVKITVGAASVRVALPSGASHEDIVRIACNTDAYIAFGDSTVVATESDALFTAGVEAFKIPQTATHVAALQESAGGLMTLTEMI
jgi:hypothetical protein